MPCLRRFCFTASLFKAFLIGVFWLVGRGAGWAQSPTGSDNGYLIEVWNTDRGLPENSVFSLTQTRDGYLWLASSQAGVVRFDGQRFTLFDPVNTPQLKQFEMNGLFQDPQGALWMSSFKGALARYENGRFTNETHIGLGSGEGVFSLMFPPTHEVLLLTSKGSLFRGIPQAGMNLKWEKIPMPRIVEPRQCVVTEGKRIWYRRPTGHLGCWQIGQGMMASPFAGLPGNQAHALIPDARGRVWAGTESGIAYFEDGRFWDQTPTNGEPNVEVQDMALAGDGGLWVRTKDRLRKSVNRQWVAEAKDWSAVPVYSSANFESGLYGDRDGGVWYRNRYQGVWRIDPRGEVAHWDQKNGLPEGAVDGWLQDDEGNVWLGLGGGGLVRMRPRLFQWLSRPDSEGRIERSVCEDVQGDIWMSGEDGRLFRQQQGKMYEVVIPATGDPLWNATLWPDRTKGVWIGTRRNGLWRWCDGQMTRLIQEGNFKNPEVRALIQGRQGRLWVGTWQGLFYRDEGDSGVLTRVPGMAEGQCVIALTEDAAGALWVGTQDGQLWRLQAGQWAQVALPAGAFVSQIWSLWADAEGSVWVGSLGNGLMRWRNGRMQRCTSGDGLASDYISQLLEDGAGNLWAGSRAGIFSVKRADLNAFFEGKLPKVNCRVLGRSDGLPAVECAAGFNPGCWRSRDGRLWFTTVKGVVSLRPEVVPANPPPPKVVIEWMKVNGRAMPTRPEGEVIHLSPGRHYVEFRFTGLGLIDPDQVRFKWRLTGLNSDWVDGGRDRVAFYSYLPPGNYQFEVCACYHDGDCSRKPATLAFQLLPYFWETWWFRLLAPVSLFVLIGAVVLQRISRRHRRQLERMQLQQQAIDQERTRIARDLHDDLGASLTQVVWLMEHVQRERHSPGEQEKLAAQITQKSRDMVRAIGEIIWAVNPKNDSLDRLVTYVGEYAEQYFRRTPIRCLMDMPESLPPSPLSAEVRQHLFLVLKEALHNVAKHSGASQVWVRVKMDAHSAEFNVEDNGRGLDPAGVRDGNGLKNMRLRAAAVGLGYELRSSPGQGTVIQIKLPLNYDHHRHC